MARPKAEIERVQTGLRLRPEILRAVKHLSVDTGKPLNLLVEEALLDLLRKHGQQAEESESGT